ncbi:MAG: zinc ribbon domain-containing protein [Acutalibacteraceae bacterium]|nr:zinc ribbon domain-containing protein [Acutalibacteraceae bacterium]
MNDFIVETQLESADIQFCKNCGERLIDNSSFCSKCGTKVEK